MSGRIFVFSFLVLCFAAGPVLAQEVIAGYDLLKTQAGSTHEDLSNLGALCPGTQVVGNPIIALRGIPLEESERPACAAGKDIGETDTFIQRLANTSGLNSGNASVPIQIVALHLQSVQPFTVSVGTQNQEWMLDVTLQPAQPIGNMSIRRTDPNGGTFSSNLQVRPHFTFTRVNPCPAILRCVVDGPLILLNSLGVPWSYQPSPNAPVLVVPGCTTNFFPGVSPNLQQNATEATAVFSETAALVAHGVLPPPPPKLHQHDWQMAVHFDFWLQNNGTGQIDDFHIKRARYVPMTPVGALADSTVYIKSVSICDLTPFWPPVPPDRWCRVDWDSLSPTYRRVAHWHFPPVTPGAMAPPMDIVFSVPCAAAAGSGAWYEVTYQCTFNCAPVDSGTFRFRCPPMLPCTDPLGCRNTPITAVEFGGPGHPIEIMHQNAPNPFGPNTTIQYQVPREGHVALHVYDAQGRLVRKLFDGSLPAGPHTVDWDGRDEGGRGVAAGAYFCQIEVAGVRQAKRMIIIR